MSASGASKPQPAGRRNEDGARQTPPAERRAGRAPDAPKEDWLPPDSQPCVWMSAGLVAYKLCERQFDCESCPLDAALGGEHARPCAAATRPSTRAHLDFRADRSYSPSHAWVQLDGTRARCGVDALAARLLDQMTGVVLPALGSHVRQGQPVCWLVDDSDPIPFKAPVSGTVVRTNTKVQGDPALVAAAPYDAGWLIELECAGDAARAGGLLTLADLRRRTAADIRRLRRHVARRALRTDERVGQTLRDGGRPLAASWSALGREQRHALVRRLLR